jgi:hypothetical protein
MTGNGSAKELLRALSSREDPMPSNDASDAA